MRPRADHLALRTAALFRAALVVILCTLCVAGAGRALAADPPALAAGSLQSGPTPDHAWLIRNASPDAPRGGPMASIVHVVLGPTGASQMEDKNDDGLRAALAGSMGERVAAAAAFGGQLFLFVVDRPVAPAGSDFPPPPPQDTRVLSLRALEGPDGVWRAGQVSSFASRRSLPAGREVLSAAASDAGLFVLLGAPTPTQGRPESEPTLLWLDGDRWRSLVVPVALTPDVRLVAAPAGVGFMRADPPTLWTASVSMAVLPGPQGRGLTHRRDRAALVNWRSITLPPIEPGATRLAPVITAQEVFDAQVLLGPTADLALRALPLPASDGPSPDWREVARIERTGLDPLLALAGSTQRLLIASLDAAPAQDQAAAPQPPAPESGWQASVLSLATGRELARGPITLELPLGGSDYRLVALVMSYVVGMLALLIFRPSDEAWSDALPDHAALADPGRRFLAGAIDLSIALLLGGLLAGFSPGEVLRISVADVLRTDAGQFLLLCALGVAIAHGFVGELWTGRTVGKLLTGCAVVRAGQGPWRSAGPWGCLVRNVVKWALPPVALLAVFSPGARHRGERYARSFVVVPVPEEQPADSDDSPD